MVTPCKLLRINLAEIGSSSGPFKAASVLSLVILLIALCIVAEPAAAQTWPQRSVKLILPFGPGSGTDIAARLLAEPLQKRWGQSVVVENRPGGDGVIAVNALLAANDDHVLLYASSASFIAHPYTLEKMPYNLDRDLAPIARVTDTIAAIGVPAQLNVKSIAELTALARSQPGKLNVAGISGLIDIVVGGYLKTRDLSVTTVPYRNLVQAASDLAENRIQFMVTSYAVLRPMADAGRIRVIAITRKEPTSIVPGVPTVFEAGHPELQLETTVGFYGPRGMGRDMRERIAKDVVEVATASDVVAKLGQTGQAVNAGGPDYLVNALKEQEANAARAAKLLGLSANK